MHLDRIVQKLRLVSKLTGPHRRATWQFNQKKKKVNALKNKKWQN